jgi:hypothetical protein
MIHIITIIIIIINMDHLVPDLLDKWLLLLHVVQLDIQHFFLVSNWIVFNRNVYTLKKSRKLTHNSIYFSTIDSTRGYDGLSPFSTPYNRSCPTYATSIPANLSSGIERQLINWN